MRASVYLGTSVDGFIAHLNGDLDFLPPGGGEPHGYAEFMETVDALVIGGNTYETVLAFELGPTTKNPSLSSVVERSRLRQLMPSSSICALDPAEIVWQLETRGISMSMWTAA